MGGCCSKEEVNGGFGVKEVECHNDDGGVDEGDGGARVRLKGSFRFASMFTQQGRKGINQDAMTIWEDFNGDKDKIFCGVFDGHGPLGHKVASHVRDVLPWKLSAGLKSLSLFDHDGAKNDPSDCDDDDDGNKTGSSRGSSDGTHPCWFTQWKTGFIKAFEEMDKELGHHSTIDCICSGSTAVSIVKQREHLIIANLGDSRAILCTRDDKKQLVPVQLTVDLKPNLPSESERILSCKGRVFALDEEPDVHRLWLPDEDCPGLAMARAFGDFCLKDFGLISTPQVSYRRLSEKDEYVVLATDGIWDVLSNKEVVKIVSSVRKRSEAAKKLVDRAVRAWKNKHPTSKVDDCAVICLFLKALPSPTKPPLDDLKNNVIPSELSSSSESFITARCEEASESVEITSGNDSKEEWTALEGMSRVNSLLKVPRFSSVLSWKR